MIVQFYIYGKSGNKLVYQQKKGQYMRNNTVITVDEYNKALDYFNSHR